MHPLIIFAVAGLVAWFNQPAPPAPAQPAPVAAPRPVDRVILLPDADGKAGAVLLKSTSGQEQVLDRAYLGADIAGDGKLSVAAQDPAAVRARYGTLLDARPLAPVSFTVYFQTGANQLTAESRATLDAVKAELARRPVPEVEVIGHTDRDRKSTRLNSSH